jgi:hypothetical protein
LLNNNVIYKAQMQLWDECTWTLRDLLGLQGQPPTAAAPKKDTDPDIEESAAWYTQVQLPWPPSLVGNDWAFGGEGAFGMPKWLAPPAVAALRRAIANARVGIHPLLDWAPPTRAASQLKLTLEDRQQLPGAAKRLVKVTLRALPHFKGTPARDYVTLDVAGDGHDRTHFGRCVLFMKDNDDNHFVAVHWLTEVEGVVVDPVTRLVPLTLSRAELTASYSVMPVSAITNGALIIEGGARLWALQSPREQRAYIASNYDN